MVDKNIQKQYKVTLTLTTKNGGKFKKKLMKKLYLCENINENFLQFLAEASYESEASMSGLEIIDF